MRRPGAYFPTWKEMVRPMCQSAHHADLTDLEQEILVLRAANAELRDRLAIAQAKAADATGTLTC
jgi:hypothetical protein